MPYAYGPYPADSALYEATWANLSWTPGALAVSHDVYIGENFDDVNDGIAETFRSNQAGTSLVVGFPGFSFPDGLVPGTTYYWRIDEVNDADPNSPWKGDVWSFMVPSKEAYNGNPADVMRFVDPNVELSWTSGFGAKLHHVYFGDNFDDVSNAAGALAVAETTFAPGTLELEKTYHWRVDEDNADGTVTEGRVWSFTVSDFILIDDFKSYDANDNQIWFSWHDGLGFGVPGSGNFFAGNGTGAAVGDETTPSFTEETIVHGGNQSMPLFYDNNKQGLAKYSETELTLVSPRDWTKHGVGVLSLWFRGFPPSAGSFTEGPVGTFTMTGSGADIWGTADQFNYAYKTLTSPGTIVARVDSIENTHVSAKAGIMIRETLDADSKYAIAVVTADRGVAFQGRTDTATSAFGTTEAGIVAPHWVKLERDAAGNFTVSHSTNGSSWVPVQDSMPTNIPMTSSVYIGLAVTSHDASATCEAKFSNVSMTGTVGPQWMSRDIGILGNSAEPLYVALSNGDGTNATVVHDDANASVTDVWTEWPIDLQLFADQGIDLTNVDKIAVGLGTRGNANVPGGPGTLFFDDIRLYRPAPEQP